MPTPTDLLRLHLRGLREQLGARSIAVAVSGALRPEDDPLLLHEGAGPIADIATAGAVAGALAAQPAATTQPSLSQGAAPGTWLVVFRGPWCAGGEAPAPSPERRRTAAEASDDRCPTVVIALGFDGEPGAPCPGCAGLPGRSWRPRWLWPFTSAAAMAVQVQRSKEALRDPLTLLPGRDEVFAATRRTRCGAPRRARSPFALLLREPRRLHVRQRPLRARGRRPDAARDRRPAARRLPQQRLPRPLRQRDLRLRAARHAGRDAAREVAERTRARLAEQPFLDGALRLSFSAGVVACDLRGEAPESAVDVVRRAQQALSRAKRSGGETALWDERTEDEETAHARPDERHLHRQPVEGLPEHQPAVGRGQRDGGGADFAALAARIVEGLMSALRPRQVALVDRTHAPAATRWCTGSCGAADASPRARAPGRPRERPRSR